MQLKQKTRQSERNSIENKTIRSKTTAT